jgi:hypothetical protein
VYVEYTLSIGAAEAFRRPVTVAAIARSCDRAKASDASERGSRIASSSCEEEEEEEDARPSAAWAGERPARRTDARRRREEASGSVAARVGSRRRNRFVRGYRSVERGCDQMLKPDNPIRSREIDRSNASRRRAIRTDATAPTTRSGATSLSAKNSCSSILGSGFWNGSTSKRFSSSSASESYDDSLCDEMR